MNNSEVWTPPPDPCNRCNREAKFGDEHGQWCDEHVRDHIRDDGCNKLIELVLVVGIGTGAMPDD